VDLNLALRTQKGSASEAIDVDTITILQLRRQNYRQTWEEDLAGNNSNNSMDHQKHVLRTQKENVSEATDAGTITILQFHLQIHRNK
jgi:hypothetical protein